MILKLRPALHGSMVEVIPSPSVSKHVAVKAADRVQNFKKCPMSRRSFDSSFPDLEDILLCLRKKRKANRTGGTKS